MHLERNWQQHDAGPVLRLVPQTITSAATSLSAAWAKPGTRAPTPRSYPKCRISKPSAEAMG